MERWWHFGITCLIFRFSCFVCSKRWVLFPGFTKTMNEGKAIGRRQCRIVVIFLFRMLAVQEFSHAVKYVGCDSIIYSPLCSQTCIRWISPRVSNPPFVAMLRIGTCWSLVLNRNEIHRYVCSSRTFVRQHTNELDQVWTMMFRVATENCRWTLNHERFVNQSSFFHENRS